MKTFLPFAFRRARSLALIVFFGFLIGTSARADVVFAWNEAMLQFSSSHEPIAPHLEVRAIAMAHLAMEEAIASTSAQGDAGDRVAAQRSAAICAAHDVLVSLLPAGAKQFDALAEQHLAGIPDTAARKRGMSTGGAAAVRVLLARENDGWVEIALSNPPMGPKPDPSEGAAAALARGQQLPPSPWLKARPFVLKSTQQFQVAEMQTLTHDGTIVVDTALQHSKLFDVVDRAAALEAAERWWSQRTVVTWNRIARQVSVGRVDDLPGQARLLVTLNVALAEATLSTMHWRHTVGTWRAMTADMWEPLYGTPPRSTDVVARIDDGFAHEFVRREMRRVLIPPTPNFPSLAATIAGAAQASLVSYFKTDQIPFTLPVAQRAPGIDGEAPAPRTFGSISAAARECAFLATLDGRHCREAGISGYTLGASIGSYVAKRTAAARR